MVSISMMKLLHVDPTAKLQNGISARVGLLSTWLVIPFLFAVILYIVVAMPARAQTDELPSVTVRSSVSTVTEGQDIPFVFSASSVPADGVTINVRFTIQGPSYFHSHDTEQRLIDNATPAEIASIRVVTGPDTGTQVLAGRTLTVTVLAGDGYNVGSPSEASVRVLERRDSRQSDDNSPAPRATSRGAPTPNPVIGSTSAATATVLQGDKLRIDLHGQPNASFELGIGWVSMDGSRVILVGVIRDTPLGQTYIIVRHEGDNRVVRRWVSPTSPLIHAIDWNVVNTQYTVPTAVLAAVPLDDRLPEHNMLARRFDGGDDRIFAFDAELQQWRHIPDWPTFQALGFYWCNVTAADAGFFERITIGPPYPATTEPERDDYPNCSSG